jgi:hypothetical protein
MLVGHPNEFDGRSTHAANHFLGLHVAIEHPSSVLAFGIIAKERGPQLRMALYTDRGGEPGVLVGCTGVETLRGGDQRFAPLSLSRVGAGKHWLMAVFDRQAPIGIDYSQKDAVVKYALHELAAPLPEEFPAARAFTGQRFNYYLALQL